MGQERNEKLAIQKSNHAQLEVIQKCELGILKEFIRICDKYGLKYFLVEGSLLGAVRHEGMIPWDDDIDVALFRDDFDKFIEKARDELRKPYKCASFYEDKDRVNYLTQMSDNRTLVFTSYKRKEQVSPVWIDVFVIDGMPRKALPHFSHKLSLLYRKLMLMWSNLDGFVVQRKGRPLYERVLIAIADKLQLSRVISTKKQLLKMDKTMRKIKVAPQNNTVNFMSEYKWKTEFPPEYYGDGKMVKFENLMVRVPVEAEKILTSIYGDYNSLPPAEERYKHKLTLVSTKD